MTFTLIKDGLTQLTATAHGTWSQSGRVDYSGDKTLLSRAPSESAGCYLGGFFSEAARKHQMQTGGNYMSQRKYGVVSES